MLGRAVRGARRLRVSESSMQEQAHPPMMQIGPATQPSLQGHSMVHQAYGRRAGSGCCQSVVSRLP